MDGETPLPAAERLALLELMTLARLCDEREGVLFRQGRGCFHLPTSGHETLAVANRHLRQTDLIFPHYRDRALMMARGLTMFELALDYFAKAGSSSGGRQLPNHYSCRRLNVVSLASPTGMQCLPAAGAGWGLKLRGSDDVVLCCLGDATTRQGEFYEALCFAVQTAAPVVFVVEDNAYGISTATRDLNPFGLGVLGQDRVIAVDGRSPAGLDAAFGAAIECARSGGGPTVVLADLDRLGSHASSDDHRLYRPAADLEAMQARDPVAALEAELIATGRLDPGAWARRKSGLREQVVETYDRAYAAADPTPERTAVAPPPPTKLEDGSTRPSTNTATILGAYTQTLEQLMADDPSIVLFGEDIADPKGGVFGLTKGLSTRFPDRVFNSPLAEATIAGVGAGLAMTGFRPVVELQFIDFAGPAFNQITHQIATVRWRTCGDWTCPVAIIAPSGAYLPSGGPWHSQSNEAWYAHTPGLLVSAPSTPDDTAAALERAVRSLDPTLILLPKHLLRREQPPSSGKAAGDGLDVRRSGADVTLVGWGNTVTLCADAADVLRRSAVDAEVVDLRVVAPCDWAGLHTSVRKTGRLVVVQEDTRTASFGQAIIAELIADPQVWRAMYAPPVLIARPDVHVGFNEGLETAVLPQLRDVLEAVRSVLEFQP